MSSDPVEDAGGEWTDEVSPEDEEPTEVDWEPIED